MSAVIRMKELQRRKSRRIKLEKLRTRYVNAKSEGEKTLVLTKFRKVAPWLSEEEFLAPIKS